MQVTELSIDVIRSITRRIGINVKGQSNEIFVTPVIFTKRIILVTLDTRAISKFVEFWWSYLYLNYQKIDSPLSMIIMISIICTRAH